MKRLSVIFISAFSVIGLFAQETYQNANLATGDLNGTARYVGMGGAMDALGADISTIATNPAGIGLFRHSAVNMSFGFVSQQDGINFADGNKTNMSFDQAGFVYSRRTGRNSFLNVAFNYHKSRNFDYILSAADALNHASQNKMSYIKGADENGFNVRYEDGVYQADDNRFSEVDYLYYNVFLMDEYGEPDYKDASGYLFNRANTGYIGEYDFNISGNIGDRLYLGLTFGISDVNYKSYSEYNETLADGAGNLILTDERRINGTGFNVKAGVIFRPVESSPFRIGVSVATPTWYDLNTSNYTVLLNHADDNYGMYDSGEIGESYDFKLLTPWKFGLSLGTTFGNWLAVGAGYEYADYGNLDSRLNTGGGYDWVTDQYWESSAGDRVMNGHTERTLKGVSTFKVGLEVKPLSKLAVRAGYNYVSPMYEDYGAKAMSIDSNGMFYSSSTDYTNWEATNRLTLGLGYTAGKLSLDLAYQYSAQSGYFSPFTSYYNVTDNPDLDDNVCNAVKVDNKRHQLLLTLGYHF